MSPFTGDGSTCRIESLTSETPYDRFPSRSSDHRSPSRATVAPRPLVCLSTRLPLREEDHTASVLILDTASKGHEGARMLRTLNRPAHLLATCLVVLAALAAAACGSSSSNSNTKSSTPSSQSSTGSGGAAPTTSSSSSSSSSGIPQNNGGDQDADNNGGPSDGDGNI